MNKRELLDLLHSLGVTPSTRLGQNFLIDPNLLKALVAESAPQPGEDILEIGSGTGILTDQLLSAGARVTAVEYDVRLADFLRTRYEGRANFTLIQADACRLDFDEIMGGRNFRCIANLPYSCGSVLIANFLEQRVPPAEMFVLLQREMADRLAAAHGSKTYGALSVRVQMAYEVALLRKLPPNVFFPPPEIDSAFVRLRQRPDFPSQALRRHCSMLVRAGFAQRRKRLQRLLGNALGEAAVDAAFEVLHLSPNVRAEEVSVEQYLRLCTLLFSADDAPPPEFKGSSSA